MSVLAKWCACQDILRVNGWPVAAGCSGVVRESARSLNSLEVFALSFLMDSPTGPVQMLEVACWDKLHRELFIRQPGYSCGTVDKD